MESSHLVISRSRRARAPRGFTLIEMLTVVAIIIFVTAVVLVGQNNFNHSIVLTDTTYTLALSIREAQSFGLSSRTFTNARTSITYNDNAYGVHLDTATPTSYIFFADVNPVVGGTVNTTLCPGHTIIDPTNPESRPGNCLYDGPTYGELVQNYSFGGGYNIGSFCGYIGTGSGATAYCSSGSTNTLEALDITFERPTSNSSLVGIINNEYTAFPNLVTQDFSTVCIKVNSPDNAASQYVKVTRLGQISVGSTCSP